MNSLEALTNLFCEANRFSCEEPKFTTHDIWEMCKQIQKDLEVLETIKKRSLYDMKKKKDQFVNKLIYWDDDLMIIGYGLDNKYKAKDYGKTWVSGKEELENGK